MIDPFIYSLSLLKRRLRSRFELDEAMKRKGVEEDQRQETLERLTELKLVDDAAYAAAYIRTKDRLAPRGEAVLRMELMKRGIPKEIATGALHDRKEEMQAEEVPDEVALAQRLVESRERTYANLDPETRKRRMMSFLQRRGFSYDTIRRILDA